MNVCENGAMSDDGGKWPAQLVKQLATSIWQARTGQGMSVLRLAAGTGELGYPIHRTAIAKFESGERMVTLAELLILAAALGTTPASLLFAAAEDEVEVLPGINAPQEDAADWFKGSWSSLLDLILQLTEIDRQLDIQRRNLFQVEAGLEKLDMHDGLKDHQRQRAEHIKETLKSLEQQRESAIRGYGGG
jgi:transcriptional regulator with XRE-family HTH domain